MKRALLIALHFPPFAAASGYRRTLKFAEGLPTCGWEPIVLTATASAYRAGMVATGEPPPQGLEVIRAFSLDIQRHFAIGGRYPGLLALPDRWSTWWLDAIRRGLAAVRRFGVSAVFSTYPISTAHLVGRTVSKRAGLPWVADFRDPMVDEHAPRRRAERVARTWVERRTIAHCTRAVFTTPAAHDLYRGRYPDIPAHRLRIIPNGYDEESFARAEASPSPSPRAPDRRLTLVHSGVLYRDVRNPTHLFQALAALVRDGSIGRNDLRLVLRAPGPIDFVRSLARDAGVLDMVDLAPSIPYVDALREMMAADGLLLLQGAGANRQVPAKVYEYFRTGRPILALVDPAGDTAGVMESVRTGTRVRMDDAGEIAVALRTFVQSLRDGTATGCDRSIAERYSRAAGARTLARLFDEVAEGKPGDSESVRRGSI